MTLETNTIALINTTTTHLISNKNKFSNSSLWTFMLEREIVNNNYEEWVERIFKLQDLNIDKLFTIYSKEFEEIVGLIRLHNISTIHYKAEVITVILEHMQKKGYGIESKKILIEYAFNTLNLNRLEFYVDQNNTNSIKSITKLGAFYEGTLREHIYFTDGYIRNSKIFSVLQSEWIKT